MSVAKRYFFEPVPNCEMCGELTHSHKILGQRLNQSQGIHPKRKEGISVTVKRCTNCGLIYCSPQPVPFNIQDHYGTPPEEYWKPEYFEITPGYFEYQIAIAKRLLSFSSGMKALDIGAGLGKAMVIMDKKGFDTYGFEASETFYERAISRMNISPNKLKLGMIENVDYPENYFDFISFDVVLEHLYHPAESIKRAMRWLKPGGVIHIEVPSADYFVSKLINLYYRFCGTNYVTHLSPMHNPYHLYEFTFESFHSLGKKLKYSVVHFEDFPGPVLNGPKMLHQILRYFMKRTRTGMLLMVWLRKE